MGNVLSGEAQTHMNTHRIRCPSCAKNFCSECKMTPYHLGQTCEGVRIAAVSRKCRFCKEVLTPDNTKLEAAETKKKRGARRSPAKAKATRSDSVAAVCNQDECQDRWKVACPKKLPCGHDCNGVKKEKQCPPCMMDKKCEAAVREIDGDDYCNICLYVIEN